MMRKNKILAVLILFTLVFSMLSVVRKPEAKSTEHRVSIVELFTATWCHYCPAAEQAVSEAYAKNGDKFVFVEYHVNDPLSNKKSEERARFYGITGTPTGVINGKYRFIGSSEIASRGLDRALYDAGKKPSVIFYDVSATLKNKVVQANCSVKETGINNNTKLFIVLAEDDVQYRGKEYRFVVRDLTSFDENSSSFFENANFDVKENYAKKNLYVLFFIQDTETNEIYNAKLLKLGEKENNKQTANPPEFLLLKQDKNDFLVHIIFSEDSSLKKFELQIAKDKNFKDIVSDKTLETKRLTIGDLPAGVYYARIRGLEESGKFTDWSETKEFTVAEKITLQPNNPIMSVNGVKKEIDPGRGTKPVIIPKWGRTVVPIRAIVEALGGTIEWNGKERKVTINFNGTTIELWIDKPQARVNGVMKWIDPKNHNVKPIIVNSRTMLPLRFVAESLGCTVNWDPQTKTITITYQAP